VATYVRGEKFKHECDVTTPLLQMTKLSSNSMDVINVYRSQGHPFPTAVQHLEDLVNIEKTTLIIGDFNFCFTDSGNNLSKHLARMKFKQLITTATHIGGNILDQAHLRSTRQEVSSVVETIAEYYTDHDLVTVLLQANGEGAEEEQSRSREVPAEEQMRNNADQGGEVRRQRGGDCAGEPDDQGQQ